MTPFVQLDTALPFTLPASLLNYGDLTPIEWDFGECRNFRCACEIPNTFDIPATCTIAATYEVERACDPLEDICTPLSCGIEICPF